MYIRWHFGMSLEGSFNMSEEKCLGCLVGADSMSRFYPVFAGNNVSSDQQRLFVRPGLIGCTIVVAGILAASRTKQQLM